MPAEFDKYATTYRDAVADSISFIGTQPEYFAAHKATKLLEIVRRYVGPPAEVRALDVGCGVGLTDALLGELAELHGVDVSADAVNQAAVLNPWVRYEAYQGKRLPYDDGSFDLVFAICVVHHVPPPEWPAFVAELARVVRTDGLVVVFEHNPLNPLTRLAVVRCEFDANAVLLRSRTLTELMDSAGLSVVERRYMLFVPWGQRLAKMLDARLGAVPLGAQHYVVAKR